jgi:hypothetical protein
VILYVYALAALAATLAPAQPVAPARPPAAIAEAPKTAVPWQTILTAAVTALLTSAGAYLLARQRISHEFRLQFRAETVIRKLLMNDEWELRSFKVIKHHIGGFEDDELRQLLVRSGAVRFTAKGEEMWGLFERTSHSLEGTVGYETFLKP